MQASKKEEEGAEVLCPALDLREWAFLMGCCPAPWEGGRPLCSQGGHRSLQDCEGRALVSALPGSQEPTTLLGWQWRGVPAEVQWGGTCVLEYLLKFQYPMALIITCVAETAESF